MNVLLINGSPNEKGCTYTALSEVAVRLAANGIDTKIFHIGNNAIHGCIGCMGCYESHRCVFTNDKVNECIELAQQADGIVVGSPVYYGGPNGVLCSFLDRMLFLKEQLYAGKPAAAVVNCRRGGASAAFDRLNKYFTIAKMPVVSSQYWNSTHGFTPEDVRRDEEGMQTMRTLGNHMAWMVKALKQAGTVELDSQAEVPVQTNFIR